MKDGDDWIGEFEWDEIEGVSVPTYALLVKVIDAARREVAEAMRGQCADAVEMDARTPGEYTFPLAGRIRALPLPGD